MVALSEQALRPGWRWPRRWGVAAAGGAVAGAVVVASLALGWLGGGPRGGKGGGMPAVVAPAARTAGAAQATNTAAHAANAAVPDTSRAQGTKKASLAAAGTRPPSGASPAPSGPTFDAAALPPDRRALLERTERGR